MVWHQWQSSNNYDVYAQRLSGTGVLLDNPATPADESQPGVAYPLCTDGANQSYPQAAADVATGQYLVVWRDPRNYSGAGYDVYGQLLAAEGTLAGPNLALSTAAGHQLAPTVAALAPTGFLTLWEDARNGNTWDLYVQRVSSAGAPLAANTFLEVVSEWPPTLALAAHRAAPQALLAWEKDGEIYAQRYHPLVAAFTATPLQGPAPLAVTFSNLSAPAADISAYHWDFGDGATDTAISPTHTYAAGGSYTVTLTITGTEESVALTRSAYISVTNDAPVDQPPQAYAGPDRSTAEGAPLTFTGVITDADTPTGHTIVWNFGDGTTLTGALTPTHTYGDNGIFTVTLTVTDTTGLSASDILVVTVANVAPAVTIRWVNEH
ncbi:MAG TPA: PKD domain-containing protein [Anaerolineae bacterium]|nr:PKD domain-containing protein [Anaerolineae bacterium]